MENQKLFLALLRPLSRQLFVKRWMAEMQYWLAFAGGFSLLVLLFARLIVIPYYQEIIRFGCVGLLAVFIFRIWLLRPTLKEAVSLFNHFVPEDRVITAFSFLGKDGLIEQLQLADTISLMKREQSRVLARKKNYFKRNWLALALLFFSFTFALVSFPNQQILLAEKKEKELAVLKKVEKQLKEKIKKEDNPIAKESLQKALDLAQKKDVPKEALEELAKQMKELELKALKEEEKQHALNTWKENLKNNHLNDLAKALDHKDLKEIMKELERLNNRFDTLTEDQKKALGNMTGNSHQLSDQDLATLEKMIKEGLNAENLQNELAAAQKSISDEAVNLRETLNDHGISANQIALNPPNANAGNQGNNQPGNKGSTNNGNNGNNPNPGNGTNSNGNSSGTGNGTGNGNGNGTGAGTGNGNGGAGLGMGTRDFLTVPEKINGEKNLETDTGNIGKGSPAEQYESNGPVLKGHIRSYREVYGNYLESYRSSTDRVKLPSDLEEIVKNYFTTLDPNKE